MSLLSFLPEPTQLSQDQLEAEERSRVQRSQSTASVSTRREPPPYGSRKSWMPRSLEDFGDGGAFPEVHVPQYPLEMGRKKRTSNALAVQVDAEGKIKYDAIARQGQNKDKVVFSKNTDMLHEDHPELQKPDEETVKAITEKARAARNKLVSQKIAAAMPVRAADKQAPAQYIRYTPSQQGLAFNSGAKQRVIRMVEMQKDPMEPPRFKINKKIPPGPPSPPAPVKETPRRKITVEKQQKWKIPPCISNWKNAKGYTIPLDKRGPQTVHINENFAKLADALDNAEKKAREAVEMRAQVEKKMAQKEKEKKEEKLRELAKMARDRRAGVKSHGDKGGEETEVRERDEIRHERRRERQHDRNISRAAPDKSFLPEPTQLSQDQLEAEERSRVQGSQSTASVSTRREPPPYGSRKSWVPRSLEQRQVVFSKYTHMLHEDHPELQKPDEETVKAITEKTRAALNKLVSQKIAAAMPVRAADKQAPAQYIRYTPSQQGLAFNSGAKQRVIRMVEMQKDPMEPPRFKINKKIPPGPPSPPAPVKETPRRKITVEEQQKWKIPPCISNWKNAKGYTIPLDKRGPQTVHINENFAKLADALDNAEKKAREAVEMRAQVEKKMAQKEKEKKEEKLRELAKMARDRRAGVKSHGDKGGEETEVRERDEIRHERRRERQHDRNISRAAPDKRSKLQRDQDRDISELIALGQPNPRTSSEAQYDQRLFNQSKGMDSGFAGGTDEIYNVYDQPFRSGRDMAQNIYRPGSSRFVPDREFSGADHGPRRYGPVQFEEDPFGLDKFFEEAKQHGGSKRASTSDRSKDYDHVKKRRKE
ncbi:SNW domain-containing protein 1-like [Pimephales promelas]|uniref:SNW domain-containing protein 1-like n=1 Tax=Pimephales promelas TaxID=90988 RepID=UPI00195574FD|nr:SNW domain-containing protein 1-like [Pimephales promelas]